jgi:hypothetical protein
MQITQITVSYGETQSLPEYSNVKPNLTITATLDAGDSPGEVELLLWNQAKAAVREQIDQALEASGRPAKWSEEPRYQVLRTYWNQWDHRGETKPPQYVIIAPDEIKLDRGAYAQRLIGDSSKLRLGHAQKVAAELLGDKDEGYTLLDCSTGDLTALDVAIGAPESNPDVAPTADSPF